MNTECIRAEHLQKIYTLKEKKGWFRTGGCKQIQAVKDISLEIPKGKIIGLLGINGAGKTTTIRMLSSILAPTAGTLTMNGVDVVRNHMWVKEKINVISGGERNLYWRLTAVENLQYFGSLYGINGRTLQERVQRLLQMVGLTEAANTPVERYSKGMKQRLQIARGLINDPEYIFLDEPTLGLDIVIAGEIRRLVRRLASEEKRGVLLTTHYIGEAEELCDYIYVLDKGACVAQGTKEELAALLRREPELKVKTRKLTGEGQALLQKNFGDRLHIEEKAGICITLQGGADEWSSLLALLTETGAQVADMSIEEPRLEDMMMDILGKSREGAI